MTLLAAIFAAAATFVTIYTLVSPGRPRTVSVRLNQFERAEAVTDRESQLAQPFSARVVAPAFGWWRRLLGGMLPTSILSKLEHWLLIAGEPISLHAFVAIQIAAIGAAALVLIAAIAGGAVGGVIAIVWLLITVAIGAAPLYWLRIKIRARKNAIIKSLPDAVDLIVTTVEAGMSIDAALAEVGNEVRGPLGDELRLAIRETTLGRSRRDALERLVARTEVPELRTFIQSIIQAEQTGIPVGQVLRSQSAQMRVRRRQRAEGEAQKAPVKMVVVLVLLTLPTLILVLLGPAMIRLSENDLF